jgi:hypothetical protein
VSRDEPFINVLPKGSLVTVPYSVNVNDFQNAFPGDIPRPPTNRG